jgi:hypothetical protein
LSTKTLERPRKKKCPRAGNLTTFTIETNDCSEKNGDISPFYPGFFLMPGFQPD